MIQEEFSMLKDVVQCHANPITIKDIDMHLSKLTKTAYANNLVQQKTLSLSLSLSIQKQKTLSWLIQLNITLVLMGLADLI